MTTRESVLGLRGPYLRRPDLRRRRNLHPTLRIEQALARDCTNPNRIVPERLREKHPDWTKAYLEPVENTLALVTVSVAIVAV